MAIYNFDNYENIVVYTPGDPLPIQNNIDRVVKDGTVVWVKVALSFDEQGGGSIDDKTVYFNNTYGTLPTPTRAGYTFNGWFTASSGGTQIYSTTVVTNTLLTQTLYAQWTYAPAVPTISYYSASSNSLSFYITNNSPYTVTIYYEQSDSTPDANSITLAANATSNLLTISGLSAGTTYTVYARSYIGGIYSSSSSFTHATTNITTQSPTINDPYYNVKTSTYCYTVTNNDGSTATIYADFNSNPTTNRGDIASGSATAVIDTGVGFTPFTIYAKAQASGEDVSNVVSYYKS